MADLQGRYVFGDLSGRSGSPKGKLFIGTEGDDGRWSMDEMAIQGRKELGEYVLAFGEDADGELYVMTSMTEGPVGLLGPGAEGSSRPICEAAAPYWRTFPSGPGRRSKLIYIGVLTRRAWPR